MPKATGKPEAGSQPVWMWVAAIAPKDQAAATLAIAKAHIQAVIIGSHADGLYVHPGDRRRAIAVLKADAAAHHYKVDFGSLKPVKMKGRPGK